MSTQGPERFLRVDHLDAGLRNRSIRGGLLMLIDQWGALVVAMGGTAVLARLLPPADFGVIAMAATLFGFMSLLKDLGLDTATVQSAEVTHRQVSTLFWLNMAASGGLMLVTGGLGPALAWFYGEPRVATVTMAFATILLFNALAVQHQALLGRQMRFGALALINFSCLLLSYTGAIALALAGAGVWALVARSVIEAALRAVAMWLACGWRPGPARLGEEVRELVSFGLHLVGYRLVNYFARNLDNVLVGWRFGAAPLGIYHRAYALVMLPVERINSPISSVAISSLSRLQDQPERLLAHYRRALFLMTSVGMPIITYLFADIELVVLNLLGDQWGAVNQIFRLLGPVAFFGTFNVATGWIFMALGMTRRMFHWGLFASACIVAGFLIGQQWGVPGIAASLSISHAILVPLSVIYCYRPTHIRVLDLLAALWRPAIASISAAGLFHVLVPAATLMLPSPARLAIHLAAFGAVYLFIWLLIPGGWRTAKELLNILRALRRPVS